MAGELMSLVCGRLDSSELGKACQLLGDVLEYRREQLKSLLQRPAPALALDGPFIVRSFIEVAITVFVGRFDPFRLLVLSRVQGAGSYPAEARSPLAINWSGDAVLAPGEKCVPLEKVDDLKKVYRSLLGDHYHEVFWFGAHSKLINQLPAHFNGSWADGIKLSSPEKFIEQRRGELRNLYSSVSKGVHPEIIVPPTTLSFDKATMKDYINSAFRLICDLGLVSHFVETSMFRLNAQDAVDCYLRLQTTEQV